MEHYLIVIGVLINCAYIIINRFVTRIPAPIAIPILLIGIGLILTGAILTQVA